MRSQQPLNHDAKQPMLAVADGQAEEGKPVDAKAKQESEPESKHASLTGLFRFATSCEKVSAVVLVVLSLVQGSLLPLQANYFQLLFMSISEPDAQKRARKVEEAVLIFVGLGTASFVLTIICYTGLGFISDRMSVRLRTRFFNHLLTKDVGWYDTHKTSELATRLTQDTYDFREGCGAKLSIFAGALVQVPVGFTVAFVKSWKITLILMAFTPFLGVAMAHLMKATQKATSRQQESYAKAGGVAETAISSIRTVQAFCGFDREIAKYDALLADAETEGVKGGKTIGCVLAFFIAMLYLLFASGFWIGAFFVVNDWTSGCWESQPPFGSDPGCMDGGAVLGAIMGIMLGAGGFAQLGTCVSAISGAKSAAGRIYDILDEPPLFHLEDGEVLPQLHGEVQFKDVTFFYPTRPEQPALSHANIHVRVGQTAAFVGPSGSGKTTVIALLQRFYDPGQGSVCIDGHDIRSLSLKFLRQQMGLVQQEPVLFSGTIEDNIRYGREGGATDEEVMAAAKLANAHNFIMDKVDHYKTQVGERGSTLSGGQKQRVAIARAMVRDPKILLLDEATSALDNESEKIVQAALDDLLLSHPRTTLVVAHRLSTIQNSHVINVLENGALKEVGTHEELLGNRGLYFELWELSLRNTDGAPAEAAGADAQISLTKVNSHNSRQGSSCVADGLAGKNSKVETDEKKEGAEKDVPEEDTQDVANVNSRLFGMQRSSINWLIFGGLGSAGSSVASPFLGSLFADSMNIIMVPPVVLNPDGTWVEIDFAHVRKEATLTFVKFASVAIGLGAAMFVAQFSFRRASEALLRKVRRETFEAMLRQETSFFDERTSGVLSDRLAQDPPKLKAFTGESLSGVVNMVLTMIAALTLALTKSPLLTGTVVALMPIMLIGHGLMAKFMSKKNETAAGPVVSEAMGNIKTVASYGLEKEMMNKYGSLLNSECKQERKTSTMSGISAAYQSALGFYLYAVLILFANVYITHCGMSQTAVFGTIFPLIFSVGALSQGSAFFMDRAKGQEALRHIFNTIDRKSKINAMSAEGDCLDVVRGEIAFRAVKFAYPTRPDLIVFKRFDLAIGAGTQVAFVGHSGSGKSTAVCLVQRFYDPMEGTVLLDGVDMKTLNLAWLRRQMGLVQQEPILFAGSVADNVRYGREDATDDEIQEVCKTANAHKFVSELESGYNTEVGERGAQLSGGQKQRIAIARALIRDPKILLLDEATSALDNESERVVQEALDRLLVVKKRTTLVVAHRLSTIANSDVICFIHEGRIVEKGAYSELMVMPDGHFRKLAERQQEEVPSS